MNTKVPQQVLAILLFVSVLIKEGLALQCYDCNTYSDPRCNNPKGIKQFVRTCSANETMCRKIEQEMTINGDDVVRIHRQCATRGSPNGDCLERTGTYNFKTWYCECTAEFCNGASITAMSLLPLTALLSLSVLRKLL